MPFADAAFVVAATFTLLHLMSVALAAPKCRKRDVPARTPSPAPFVSVVQPVCGIENYSRETIAAAFDLDYPAFELVYCVARGDDPVATLVREAMTKRPDVSARLLVGDERPTGNPKLNNVVKGWHAAKGQFVAMIDSNLLMPRDIVQRLLEAFEPGVGLVSTAPVGERPRSLGAELECAFLNTHQARWQFAGDATRNGFAQGKALFCRKDFLDSNGGILALGDEAAEDAASTKVVRAAGLRVTLVDGPFAQPLGVRAVRAVVDRQRRWSRLRRATFPATYAPEVLCGIVPPLAACVAGALMS
ncbi:MAG: glycosyltransferase, partial [Hyphomicrobiales bacterium]|nr:glycosyltransferase [Hyphomicrobiales bacterium]